MTSANYYERKREEQTEIKLYCVSCKKIMLHNNNKCMICNKKEVNKKND